MSLKLKAPFTGSRNVTALYKLRLTTLPPLVLSACPRCLSLAGASYFLTISEYRGISGIITRVFSVTSTVYERARARACACVCTCVCARASILARALRARLSLYDKQLRVDFRASLKSSTSRMRSRALMAVTTNASR